MHFRNKIAVVVALAVTSQVSGTAVVDAASGATSLSSVTAWKTVINDKFDSGGLPSHWRAYNGPYGSGVRSCAVPSHNTVSGGYLHLKFSYEASRTAGKCGAAWYSGGLSLKTAYSSVSQRVTLRFRVLQTGGVAAHRIIPMRWPDVGGGRGGEEDYCESTPVNFCATFLHGRNGSGRVWKKYFLNLGDWHVFQVTRNGYRVTVRIDGRIAYDFKGNSASLPPTLKHVVLQQECRKTGCPKTKRGKEDIQIDWIRVENPA